MSTPADKLKLITEQISQSIQVAQPPTTTTTATPRTSSAPAAPMSFSGFGSGASSFASNMNKLINPSDIIGSAPIPTTLSSTTKKNKSSNSGDSSDEGLLAGLFKIFLAVLKIPTQFDTIFKGVTNAGLSLATGIGGITQTTFLGLKDLVILVIAVYTFVAKYIGCFINFLVNLPSCFISHVITCIFSVLYLIFPLTAWIFWMLTDFDLMPYFETAFDHIADGDDMLASYIGFNFLKFPPAIIKKCYTCNGETLRLKTVLTDALKIKRVGDIISHDATKTVPQYMAPAMPYLYNTADAVQKLFG